MSRPTVNSLNIELHDHIEATETQLETVQETIINLTEHSNENRTRVQQLETRNFYFDEMKTAFETQRNVIVSLEQRVRQLEYDMTLRNSVPQIPDEAPVGPGEDERKGSIPDERKHYRDEGKSEDPNPRPSVCRRLDFSVGSSAAHPINLVEEEMDDADDEDADSDDGVGLGL